MNMMTNSEQLCSVNPNLFHIELACNQTNFQVVVLI